MAEDKKEESVSPGFMSSNRLWAFHAQALRAQTMMLMNSLSYFKVSRPDQLLRAGWRRPKEESDGACQA